MGKYILNKVIIVILFGLITVAAYAETPTDVIKKANKKISEIKLNNQSQAEIEDLVGKELEKNTSFSKIADNVKASICKSVSEDKCKEFYNSFLELIKITYTKKLSKYYINNSEYLGESVNGKKATVKTKVITEDKEISIVYELEKISNKWMIINYIFDDINTTENYKKQFNRMLKKSSIDKIIDNLNKKNY